MNNKEQATVQEAHNSIVASNKKHAWSKKERLALYVAGFFALVGIGFGGYTFYNQVILNAAGEDSLGADVSVDLPAANESPYFKITGIGKQDVHLTLTGDAGYKEPDGSHSTVGLEKDWRIEQSSDPNNDSSWLTIADHNSTVFAANSHMTLLTNRETSYAKTILYPGYDLSEDKILQPSQTYYLRISKQVTSQNADGSIASTTWVPQGNIVSFTTQPETSLSLTNDSGQITLAWASAGVEPENIGYDYHYLLVRAKDLKSFSNLSSASMKYVMFSNAYNTTQQTIYDSYVMGGDSVSKGITASSLKMTQPKGSTYYYALIQKGTTGYGTSPSFFKIISAPQPVTVGTNTSLLGGSVTLSNNVINGSNINNLTATIGVKNNSLSWSPYTSGMFKTWYKTSTGYGSDIRVRPSSSQIWTNDPTTTLVLGTGSSDNNLVPGSYTLTTNITASDPASSDLLVETVTTPITIVKAPSRISATFQNATVKYKKDVVINISNSKVLGYSYLPEGQITIKNLNTGKILKTITLGQNMATAKVTLKNVKKGKYNIAVLYQASTKPTAIFEDKTINLPKLTVK